MRLRAPVGVFSFERENGNDIRVDAEMSFDALTFEKENLDSTVNYADVCMMIRKIMEGEWLLLESVAKEIAERIFAKWPGLYRISVKLTKLHPPIPDFTGSCSAEYILSRN